MASAVTSNQLAAEIAESVGVKPSVAKKVIAAFFERIGDHLAAGNDVSVRQFGSFRGKYTPARKASVRDNPFNPGTEMKVEAKPAGVKVRFFASSLLKERASKSARARASK